MKDRSIDARLDRLDRQNFILAFSNGFIIALNLCKIIFGR